MTIKEVLNQAVIMMKNENIEAPKNKARILLEFTLKKPREYIMIYDKAEIAEEERNKYIKNVKRLILGEPLQYITGKQEFMKLNFLVTKDVLIPQPDTEILVEEVIKKAKEIHNPVILDLCTGSGAIAVAIAKNVPGAKIYASDISKRALEIAKKNAEFNGVKNNIEFLESDLFTQFKNEKFDIIVSNPPYIERALIKTLPIDVQNEPKIALDGGIDGLDFYRKIVKESLQFLNRQGYLCLEIGYNQKLAVKNILDMQKRYINIYCKKDLCENDRVIIAQIG